jgi:hypothetical protein
MKTPMLMYKSLAWNYVVVRVEPLFGEKVHDGTFHISCHIQYNTMKCHKLLGSGIFQPDPNRVLF